MQTCEFYAKANTKDNTGIFKYDYYDLFYKENFKDEEIDIEALKEELKKKVKGGE